MNLNRTTAAYQKRFPSPLALCLGLLNLLSLLPLAAASAAAAAAAAVEKRESAWFPVIVLLYLQKIEFFFITASFHFVPTQVNNAGSQKAMPPPGYFQYPPSPSGVHSSPSPHHSMRSPAATSDRERFLLFFSRFLSFVQLGIGEIYPLDFILFVWDLIAGRILE